MTFIKFPAEEIPYDNLSSGLTSTEVNSAIDELDGYSVAASSLKKIQFLRFSRSSIITASTPGNPGDGHFYAGASGKSSTISPLRSGNGNLDLNTAGSLCPIYVPFNGTIVRATATISQTGVAGGTVVYPVNAKYDLEDITFSGRSKIQTIEFPIDNTHPVGTFYSLADTNYRSEIDLNIPISEGQMLALLFNSNLDPSELITCAMTFITFTVEEL